MKAREILDELLKLGYSNYRVAQLIGVTYMGLRYWKKGGEPRLYYRVALERLLEEARASR